MNRVLLAMALILFMGWAIGAQAASGAAVAQFGNCRGLNLEQVDVALAAAPMADDVQSRAVGGDDRLKICAAQINSHLCSVTLMDLMMQVGGQSNEVMDLFTAVDAYRNGGAQAAARKLSPGLALGTVGALAGLGTGGVRRGLTWGVMGLTIGGGIQTAQAAVKAKRCVTRKKLMEDTSRSLSGSPSRVSGDGIERWAGRQNVARGGTDLPDSIHLLRTHAAKLVALLN